MILVTGSCGSIGSALCKSLSTFLHEPLFEEIIKLDIRETRGRCVDICDMSEVERVIGHYKPRVVIHAAANKYVDYLESHVDEAININTLGTRNVVLACRKYSVPKMLLISTDKANNPVNILGYSKRAAEIYTLLSGYSIIRLVNVYESSGNVVELFKKQISDKQPVTVTDPNMTRYFVSLNNACVSILRAVQLSLGKDMFYVPGKLTRILDLATELIGDTSIPIMITQPRPGDRMEEEKPIPDDANMLYQTLWRSFFSSDQNAERWIEPLLVNRSVETLIQLCK